MTAGRASTAPFNAPSLGPPPWNVYRIEPRSAIVTLAAEPGGLTSRLQLEIPAGKASHPLMPLAARGLWCTGQPLAGVHPYYSAR